MRLFDLAIEDNDAYITNSEVSIENFAEIMLAVESYLEEDQELSIMGKVVEDGVKACSDLEYQVASEDLKLAYGYVSKADVDISVEGLVAAGESVGLFGLSVESFDSNDKSLSVAVEEKKSLIKRIMDTLERVVARIYAYVSKLATKAMVMINSLEKTADGLISKNDVSYAGEKDKFDDKEVLAMAKKIPGLSLLTSNDMQAMKALADFEYGKGLVTDLEAMKEFSIALFNNFVKEVYDAKSGKIDVTKLQPWLMGKVKSMDLISKKGEKTLEALKGSKKQWVSLVRGKNIVTKSDKTAHHVFLPITWSPNLKIAIFKYPRDIEEFLEKAIIKFEESGEVDLNGLKKLFVDLSFDYKTVELTDADFKKIDLSKDTLSGKDVDSLLRSTKKAASKLKSFSKTSLQAGDDISKGLKAIKAMPLPDKIANALNPVLSAAPSAINYIMVDSVRNYMYNVKGLLYIANANIGKQGEK